MTAPKQFVGLHAHTTLSVSDGFGQPEEHIEYVTENGMDALALTEHGNMNSFPHAYLKAQELKKKGKNFKFLPGLEAYYHPDLEAWRRTKAEIEEAKKEAKKAERDLAGLDEEDVGATVENEEDSKNVSKWMNPVNRRHHLVLLAKSNKGLENMFRLVSRSYKEGFYKFPRIDRAMLKEFGEDIVVTSACLGGVFSYDMMSQFAGVPFEEMDHTIGQKRPELYEKGMKTMMNTLDELSDAVGRENVFAELQFNKLAPQHLVNRALIDLHKRTGVTLTAAADSHYPNPKMWQAREIYRLLGRMRFMNFSPDLLPESIEQLKCQLFPKNAEQMWNSYHEYRGEGMDFYDDDLVSKAIETTWNIAHDVIGDIKVDNALCLPKFVVPNGMTDMQALVEACKDGLRARGLANKPEYIERLKMELLVVKEKNFARYFLTMKKIIDIAHQSLMVGAGRGSGPGALINYVLNITDLDPITNGLYFERFLNKVRAESPDIDSDVSDRDKLISLMKEDMGDECVIPITNWNLFQLKSLVKDISKFYGLDFAEVNEVTSRLDADVRPYANSAGENKSLFQLKYDDCLTWSPRFKEFIEKYPQVGEHIKNVYKNVKSAGRHAGGVLVAEDIEGKLPLITVRGEIQTPWAEGMNVKHIEVITGIPKFDLLGLDTLRMIQRCIEIILIKHEGIENPTFPQVKKWYDEHLKPGVVSEDDPKVFEHVFGKKRFAGIFQFTAKHTQRFIHDFEPKNVQDLAQATAIYRPGPLAAKVDKLMIESRRKDTRKIYNHPDIDRVLEPTRGYVIFQEQLMQLAHELAGMSLVDCDRLRKAILKRSVTGMGKNKSESQILEEVFLDGAEKNNYPRDKAKQLYEDLAAFSNYAFNKSHSLAYAFCSYQTAWLMTYFEPEWLCAYIESMIGDPDSRAQAISEIKSFGYKIGKVDINISSYKWEIDKEIKTFFPSFRTVKGVGDAAIEEILRNRPYESLDDLLWNEDGKWRHSKFNKRCLENLIKVEAFDSMGIVNEKSPAPFSSYKQMHMCLIEEGDSLKKKKGRESLSSLVKDSMMVEDWTTVEKIAFHRELIGDIDVSLIVPQELQDYLSQKEVKSIGDMEQGAGLAWFVLTNSIQKLTKNKKPYLLLHALDAAGKQHRIFAWGAPNGAVPDVNCAYLAEVEKNDFGLSLKYYKMKRLDV